MNTTKDWAGNWYKIVGGSDTLAIEFQGYHLANFTVPYIIERKDGSFNIQFLQLDNTQKGKIFLQDHQEDKSVILLPFSKTSILSNGSFPLYQFVLTIASAPKSKAQEEALIAQLQTQIADLEQKIAKLQVLLKAQTIGGRTDRTCGAFMNNLYFGMKDHPEVICLQEFLKRQGPDIYPEGLATGNFFSLTQAAVIRFQEKHAEQILLPLGFRSGTGYFGSSTRAKANQLISH